MTKRKLFQYNFTTVDNYIVDNVMREISGNEFQILLLIVRFTTGYHKDRDRVSYSQVKEYTGIKSNTTVSNALKRLSSLGYIVRYVVAKHPQFNTPIYEYSVNYAFEIEEETPSPENELEEETPSPENELGPSPENEHSKENKETSIFGENWRLVLNFLSISMGRLQFEKHFKNSTQVACDADTLTVRLQNKSSLEWLPVKFERVLKRCAGAANISQQIIFTA